MIVIKTMSIFAYPARWILAKGQRDASCGRSSSGKQKGKNKNRCGGAAVSDRNKDGLFESVVYIITYFQKKSRRILKKEGDHV